MRNMEECYIYETDIKLIQLYLQSYMLKDAINESNRCIKSLHFKKNQQNFVYLTFCYIK